MQGMRRQPNLSAWSTTPDVRGMRRQQHLSTWEAPRPMQQVQLYCMNGWMNSTRSLLQIFGAHVKTKGDKLTRGVAPNRQYLRSHRARKRSGEHFDF